MAERLFTLEELRAMIGMQLRFQGRAYRVIEVIEDKVALVLQAESTAQSEIQPDAYGHARRQTRQVVTVPVFNDDRSSFHATFLELERP